MGGHHNASRRHVARLLPGGGQDGGHQIGEALADARAGLDDQVVRPLDGATHSFGHANLLFAVLIVGQSRGNPSARPKDVGR
jgi:hypothetical protein